MSKGVCQSKGVYQVKDLKQCVFSWSDMEQFGILHLTGEADALNLRGLFDLTEEGCSLIRSFLNLPEDTKFRPNMNRYGVANIALPYSILVDLAVVAYIKVGFKIVLIQPGDNPYVMAVSNEVNEDKLREVLDTSMSELRIIRAKA